MAALFVAYIIVGLMFGAWLKRCAPAVYESTEKIMSDKEPYCEGGYRGCPTMKQIAELEATIARLRGAAKIVIDEHTRLVEINATGGSEAIDGLEEALRESGDTAGGE